LSRSSVIWLFNCSSPALWAASLSSNCLATSTEGTQSWWCASSAAFSSARIQS
jgi:hypothetical protein